MTILLAILYAAFISLGLPDAVVGAAWPSMHVDLRADPAAAALGGVVGLRKVESLADVGSGTGLLGIALIERAASRIKRGTFIDPSEGMRAEVNARLKDLRIEKSFKTADIDISQVDLGNLGAQIPVWHQSRRNGLNQQLRIVFFGKLCLPDVGGAE